MVFNHKNRGLLFITLLILTALSTISIGFTQEIDEKFCQDELSKRIKIILQKDNGKILSDAFNIATLKLSYKLIKDGNKKKTLEEHIKNKVNKLSFKNKSKLIDDVKRTYAKFGKPKTQNQINEIIKGLEKHNYFPRSKRLSNEETSVIMMAYKLLDPPSKDEISLNDNDISVTWFMGQVAKRAGNQLNDSKTTNLLESSVKIAHMMGIFQETRALTENEIINDVTKLEDDVKYKLDKVKADFLSDFQSCVILLGGDQCINNQIQISYQDSLKNILNEIVEDEIAKTPDELKVKLSEGLTLNLKNSLIFKKSHTSLVLERNEDNYVTKVPRRINTPIEKITKDSPISCDGESYEGEIRNVSIDGFDWLRALGMGKNAIKNGKASQFDPNEKVGKLFAKICPTIPLVPGWLYFKCAPYLKLFKYTIKKAEAKVCCKDQIQWEPYSNRFISFTGGIEAKVFMGLPDKIPYVTAQFGGLVGINLGFSVGGGEIPQGCGNKQCIQGTARVNAYGGLYLDLGVSSKKWGSNKGGVKETIDSKTVDRVPSAIGGEAKIVWKPNATLRQCLYPENNIPPAEVKTAVGKVWIQGTFYVGWIYTYDFYRPLVDSDKKDTTDLPIF